MIDGFNRSEVTFGSCLTCILLMALLDGHIPGLVGFLGFYI